MPLRCQTRPAGLEVALIGRCFLRRRQRLALQARESEALLSLTFVTVTDYLFLLRAASRALAPMGPRAMLYLAAAVSDYYLPATMTVGQRRPRASRQRGGRLGAP